MKKFFGDFSKKGCAACGFGPLVLAVIYLILHRCGIVQTLSAEQVYTGIFSLFALAFIAGGMNAVYQIERLPLMAAILIHGAVLYAGYLGTYLLNSWLARSVTPILVFTAIFIVGFIVIWTIIYTIIKKDIAKINQALSQQQAG